MDAPLQAALSNGSVASADLRAQLRISQPSLSRLIESERRDVAVLGRGRATRYALFRRVRDLPAEIPVYRISSAGAHASAGLLVPIQPDRYWYHDLEQPRLSAESDSLPWFISDMRPQGYLGRLFPQTYPELDLPDRVDTWNEDQSLYALARRGDDVPGDLIVGDEALARWLSSDHPAPAPAADPLPRYADLANLAVAGEAPGSSAGGEYPKFATALREGMQTRHVLVKFSPRLDTASGQRWSDLLVAEQLASEVLRAHGHDAVRSRYLRSSDRAFLQVERFDRTGVRGRSGLVSLAALDDEFVGERRGWSESAAALLRLRLIGPDDARELRWLSAFGALIANTDMHLGNVSFRVSERRALTLAPTYDMLPMAFAPVREEVPARPYALPNPRPGHADQWLSAMSVARAYWQRLAEDDRLSASFRATATDATRALVPAAA